MQKKRKLQFTPEASQRLAKSVGYTGLNDGSPKAAAEYGEFLQKNPDAGRLMNHYKLKLYRWLRVVWFRQERVIKQVD